MLFGSAGTIRNARLEGTVLHVACRRSAGGWNGSQLNLNHYLGNKNGVFDWEGENFNSTAKDLRFEGSTLSARLKTLENTWLEASVDLEFHLTNEDGHLMIAEVHRSGPSGFAESCRNAVMHGGVLHAECFTVTGGVRNSSFNLDECLGNSDGEFRWGWENFSASAQDVRLDGTFLHARLATVSGEWRSACTDLQAQIRNIEGKLLRLGLDERRILRDYDELRAQDDRRQALTKSLGTRQPYQYDPLRKETNLRLLKLEPPGQDFDVISCSLVEVEMGSAERFAALSYTWGSPFPPIVDSVEHRYTQSTTILCNGNQLQIKQNLYDALYRLRDRIRTEKSQAHPNMIDLDAGVQSGSLFRVEDMLRLGADVKARDSSGRTALHLAAMMGHLDMAKALVMAGSDIHALCKLNKRPLDYAKEGSGPNFNSVANFLDEERESGYVRHRANSSLHLEVTEFEYFWIDAICINQADEIEKSAQVAMMGDIYRASGCVNVWLGREFHNYSDSTELLLQGVWRLEQAREKETLSADSLEQLINDPVATFRQLGDSRISRVATEWLNTLNSDTITGWFRAPHLFRRSWFNRAWILQEVFTARDLNIVCGRYVVPWDIFLLMSSIVECCRSLLGTNEVQAIFPSTVWDPFYGWPLPSGSMMLRNEPTQEYISPLRLAQWRTECQHEGRLSMVSALSLSRNQKATDDRDKVFSVLAFSPIERNNDSGIQSIEPDYSLSAEWLYVEVAKSLVAAYGPCILSLSGLSNRSRSMNIPSWVPDLNSQITSRLQGINVRQLHHTTSITSGIGKVARQSPSGIHITSQDELIINCHLWDVVAETSHSGLNEVGKNLDGLARWLEILSKLDGTPEQRRQALSCSLAERPSDEYFNANHFEDWLKFLCFTCITGQQQTIRDFATPIGNIQDAQRLQEQEPTEILLSRTKEYFAKLGYTLSPDTISHWSDDGTWGSGVTDKYLHWHVRYTELTRDATHYGQMLHDINPTRRLLRTSLTNKLGTGPNDAWPGDVIVLVEGVNVPYLLRMVRDGMYTLIGEAYIHDLDVEEMLVDAKGQGRMRDLCIV